MSDNETKTDTPAEAPAPAPEKSAASKKQEAPRQVSRLYSRLRRDKPTGQPQPSAALSNEPVTEIDNLPVRATAPAHLVGDSDAPRDDRPERSERRDRFDRGDRGDRGRNRRGPGERRSRDDRYDDRPRERNRHRDDEVPAKAPVEAEASTAEEVVVEEKPVRPADDSTPTRSATIEEKEERAEDSTQSERQPRRNSLRFETPDESEDDRSHLIQEFKPSRHAARERKSSQKPASTGSKGSLIGWIKSVFTGGDEVKEAEKPKTSRGNQSGGRRPQSRGQGGRGQGGRGQGGRGPRQDQPGNSTDGEGRPRRRRRRRRNGPGGGQGGGGNRPPRNN